jgi:4-nitrophenyl phosphatase
LILDMDGVLWRGSDFLPGIGELFEVAGRRGLRVAVATNNATVSPSSVVGRLAQAGVSIDPDRVLTSAHAAAGYLRAQAGASQRVFVIGEDPLHAALKEAGLEVVPAADHVGAVVVGMDRSLDWPKLIEATLAIRAGALFVGTNPDPTFPSERGLGPGNGAVLAALHAATGVTPIIVGKPEAHLFLESARRLGIEPGRALIVGDRIATDIVGALRAGMPSAVVLTGVTTREALGEADIKPDLLFEGLPDLSAWLDATG